MSWSDRYGQDVLSGTSPTQSARRSPRGATTDVPAEPGLVVEDVETGWCGAVVRVEKSGGTHVVELEDRRGRVRTFPLGPGFLLDGAPVALVPHRRPAAGPATAGQAGTTAGTPAPRTASGSLAVQDQRARVARGSRIWVEGRHDAELVERVWGDDLRVEGVVVEMLDGVDDLAARVADFSPGPGRRLGILVDHLVEGTKEWREAERAMSSSRHAPFVTVTGHPYVDVWQAVKPQRLGLSAWPVVPRGQPWKHGVLASLGWPHRTQTDVALGWRRILVTVRDWNDLEPALLGRVEELIDFVTGDELDT